MGKGVGGKRMGWGRRTLEFSRNLKKYGNGPKIGRNPPPLMENSRLFFFFFEPFPYAKFPEFSKNGLTFDPIPFLLGVMVKKPWGHFFGTPCIMLPATNILAALVLRQNQCKL